jgi:hypothetical protein
MLLCQVANRLIAGKKAPVAAWKGFRKKVKKKTARPECKICAQRAHGGAEVYELSGPGGISIYDVEKAKQIAADGRRAEQVPIAELSLLLAVSEYEEAHLAHVDTGKPGIIGQRFRGPFLLDGVHRAARCLLEKRPFPAFFLTPQETLSCLMSQDLWESNIGMAVRELRQLLQKHPEAAYLEVNLGSDPQALEQIKKLLTPQENARIVFLPGPPGRKVKK